MKLFKSVDDKLAELGFKKVYESDYVVQYEKYEEEFKYTHCLDLLHKASGEHLIQSYQMNINKDGFNNLAGLTQAAAKLALKKMKQKGFT